jgi:hypothetical protein
MNDTTSCSAVGESFLLLPNRQLIDLAREVDLAFADPTVDEKGKDDMQLAQESWGLVYPIRYQTKQIIGDLPKPAPRLLDIQTLANETGGEVLSDEPKKLETTFQTLIDHLRSRYNLAFVSTNKNRDGTTRKLRLDLTPAIQKSRGKIGDQGQTKLYRTAKLRPARFCGRKNRRRS